MAGALPLYGTCVAFSPLMLLNHSATKCAVAPVPEDANVYLPGFAFTWAMNSGAVFAGNDGWLDSTYGDIATFATAASSRSGSYGAFCSKGLIETGPDDPASK